MKKFILMVAFAALMLNTNAQKVIPLYPGVAPGSENWTYSEKEAAKPKPVIYNISKPTLTVYSPDPAKANGTAIVMCPGGGFFVLALMDQCEELAHWLNDKGVTVFMLKYRLGQSFTDNPAQEMFMNMAKPDFAAKMNAIMALAAADGRASIKYVRDHAAEYGVSPSRIGIIGFSAGAAVADISAINYQPANRPDFVVSLYGYIPPEFDGPVPTDAPPMFLAAADNDPLGLSVKTAELYLKWHNAKCPAELHIYQKGGHGFETHKQNIPTDTWTDRFADWLGLQGLLKPAK
jgi:acetyl esterase/lipase